MENKTPDVPLQLISPVRSLFHAAPRQQAELLWLLLYNPIFTFRNGIIFPQKNSDPFALVQRQRRQHHRCSMIGSCGSAGSTQWRWGRRRVHDPAQAGLRRERRRASRARSHISWATVEGVCSVSLSQLSIRFMMSQMCLTCVIIWLKLWLHLLETFSFFTRSPPTWNT